MNPSVLKNNPFPQLVDELLDEELMALRRPPRRQELPLPPAEPRRSTPAPRKLQPKRDPNPEVSVIPASHKAARDSSRSAKG